MFFTWQINLKGPFTYLGNFMVNQTAYSLLIGISLTFQRQLWPEKKSIFRSEFEGKGTVPLSYSCLQTPPRKNWFYYVRREYATAINFPYIITLKILMFDRSNCD